MADATTGRLVWDETGEREYETGVRMGVLYPISTDGTYPTGYAWNGLSDVKDSPDGGEAKKLYANDGVYIVMRTKENAKGTIEAYSYPDAWNECDGRKTFHDIKGVTIGQQTRKAFGFCWRSVLGNDTEFDEHGYILHIRYGCTASPSEKDYQTEDDDPDINPMSWEYETQTLKVDGYEDSSVIDIRSTDVNATNLAKLEDILYGSSTAAARLPLPDEIAEVLGATAA